MRNKIAYWIVFITGAALIIVGAQEIMVYQMAAERQAELWSELTDELKKEKIDDQIVRQLENQLSDQEHSDFFARSNQKGLAMILLGIVALAPLEKLKRRTSRATQ